MKTNIYNKKEHLEGYVGSGEEPAEKSDLQKEYEKGNEGNEVTSFGKITGAKPDINENPEIKWVKAKDGLNNTGTQGKDSLSDDAYNNEDREITKENAESGTGSSSEDFKTAGENRIPQRDEDDVLNTGL